MQHLTKDLYIDADQYCFIITRKTVAKSGESKGKERFENDGYLPTISSVERFIANEGAKEWVNGDWNRMTTFINEALANFRTSLPELVKKRYL